MIKKISQLLPLSAAPFGTTQTFADLIEDPETADAAKEAVLIEVSFKNRETDEGVYYNSYNCTLKELEQYLGIAELREQLNQLKTIFGSTKSRRTRAKS